MMLDDRAFVVMDRVPGSTLNELTYRRPEVLEEHKITIAYQLGMHMAFAYVFGSKDGYQTNYIFNPVDKILTRVDKESFLDVPDDPHTTLEEGNVYTQEIAACELSNLKYIPSFRSNEDRPKVLFAFKQGFMDKYEDIKEKKNELLGLVDETRETWLRIEPPREMDEYHEETRFIRVTVEHLMDQDPVHVLNRLVKAKEEVDRGEYKK
ncbi:MAG: hypothetical protein GF416_03590 [Candidatus Altiarchaeales archaeon]|nr:hypothetical protein [Candidatus Altiarchaeales archaeon]MBD3416202.1 hypothetical protein [Candidatus Altiarchaeales archaeon]